jgi:hypothetical protein
MKRAVALPPEMVQFFSAYMEPADLHDAQLARTRRHGAKRWMCGFRTFPDYAASAHTGRGSARCVQAL